MVQSAACSVCTISFSGVHAVTFSIHCFPILSIFDSTFTSIHRLQAKHRETNAYLLTAFSVLYFYLKDYQLPNNPGKKSTWGWSRHTNNTQWYIKLIIPAPTVLFWWCQVHYPAFTTEETEAHANERSSKSKFDIKYKSHCSALPVQTPSGRPNSWHVQQLWNENASLMIESL